jgi:hypothetical protein
MGRKSREKRERREEGGDSVAHALKNFSTASLYPLLDAASVSPTAAHRGPSIATLFYTAVRRRRTGARPASPADLPPLVAAARIKNPAITTLEDFQPYDIRSEVLTRWGSNLFRIVPGSLERPTAMVSQHAGLAAAIDGLLVAELGFGLRDVGEIILRRLNEVAARLAPYWPDDPAAAVGSDPLVSEAEVVAAGSLPTLTAVVEACTDVNRARAAAARYVVPSGNLRFDPSHPVATFGTAIAAKVGTDSVWLPSGILIEALPAIGAHLSAYAASKSDRVNDVYIGTVGNHVGRLLQGSGLQITGPIWAGSSAPIQSLVTFNDRQILALDIAAGLTPRAIQARLAEGGQALAEVQPGAEVRNPVTSWRLPSNAQIVRLQVVAGPMHAVPLGSSGPTMTVEDLEWILYSAQRSREDLWYFVRDLEHPRGIGGMFAWDLIDRWEVWKQQKSFYRGGVLVTSMMFSPHAAVAEWREAANAAPAERALHVLDLPPLRDWPIVALDHRRGTEVGDMNTDRVYQIMSWTVPVAVAKVDLNGPPEHFSTLWSLAVGIAWKLDHCADAFLTAALASRLTSLRIEFEFRTRASGPALTIEQVGDGVLTIGWDDGLQHSLAENSFAVETLCGQLVSQVFVDSARDDFQAAWEAAPPGVRIDRFSVRQQVQRLPEPLEVHEAVRSEALRRLGEHLATEQVRPSLLDGAAATRFESRMVFPWLVEQFHQSIAQLRADDLLVFAFGQLECSSHQRFMLDKRVSWERGFPVQGEDDAAERRERIARATRVISFIIEEVLAHPPVGNVIVDHLAWIEALSIGELCIESCFRSDAIHFQLTRTAVEISDLYEVNVVYSDDATDVDVMTYNKLRSVHMLPTAVPIATDQHVDTGDVEPQEPRPVVELMPELADIDAAMRASLGFGIDAVTGVLNVATQYDATPDAPATATTPGAFVEECVNLAVGATREEFAAALDWLTLRGTNLAADVIPHWETERRAKRITTSPFVQTAAGTWVLPWTAESTLKIVANYLGDGRLPWPNTALPREVTTALDQYRQGRNRDVERKCVAALSARSFLVRGSIKPEKAHRYGITSLTGEIDALCIDPARSRIWVIEAKDPYTPYSARQIRRLVNDFLAPGKYVDQLLRKVADVQASAASVAAALGASDSARSWTVTGLMVTRHLEPAAFAVEPKVPFCVLDDVAEIVDRDELAGPGMHLGSTSAGE